MTSSSANDFPSVRFTIRSVQNDVLGGVVIATGQFTPAFVVIEGVDLVNESLTEGQSASVFVEDPGSGQPNTVFLQAFVYATSQGQFAWRGSMVLFPNEQLAWSAILGTWHLNVWGRVEPNFGIEA